MATVIQGIGGGQSRHSPDGRQIKMDGLRPHRWAYVGYNS